MPWSGCDTAPHSRGGGWPLSRGIAVLAIYALTATVMLPLWMLAGHRFDMALDRMTSLVPQHTARFVDQLHTSERWHQALGLPPAIHDPIERMTRRVTHGVEREARALGIELAGIRRLVPWLSMVPVAAFLMLTRWTRFRRSRTRVLPTPHLQWRGNEFLRNLNGLLAAYTRAQALSALIVVAMCWPGFAALRLSYPGTLAISAGLLEMVPLAGPIIAAVVATAMATDHVVPVLVFLAALRLVQDYVIYPRLISRAMHLHPLAVVVLLWAGAAIGGVIGVCLAVPVVGAMQVTYRHWREYHEIENLVGQVTRGVPA
ncbi:MAG: AI-2E family transporter [Luteitalea sp.]|nr:AI-2E family transporter [Luteitalea sp.]